MSRINTNVSALTAQHHLQRSNSDLQTRLQRLSTGLRINSGADDPAGLIVSERLRAEVAGVGQAIDNAERASNVIATAEAALAEVSDLLTSIKSLTIQAANTGAFSKSEIEANQLQIDSAIESIERISNTTSFAGLKLLNGSLDYLTEGAAASALSDISVYGVNFGANSTMPVTVDVINSAENAQLFLSGSGATPTIASSVTIEVRGPKGVAVVSLTSGQSFSSVMSAVNSFRSATGVSASIVDTSGLVLNSQELGSDSFVSVKRSDNKDFMLDALGGSPSTRDTGEDVLALINGNLALGDGKNVSLRTTSLNLEIELTTDAAQNLTGGTPHTFDITGGGTVYQLGAAVDSNHQVGFGIQSVNSNKLGNSTLGFLNTIKSGGANSLIAGGAAEASLILDESISQIATLRGRLGAFERNTLDTTIRSQQISLENLTASESQIRDADFAAETAQLTRAQILQNAGTSTLGIANSTSQSVLSLLQ